MLLGLFKVGGRAKKWRIRATEQGLAVSQMQNTANKETPIGWIQQILWEGSSGPWSHFGLSTVTVWPQEWTPATV